MRGLAVALTVYINTVFSTEKKKKKNHILCFKKPHGKWSRDSLGMV